MKPRRAVQTIAILALLGACHPQSAPAGGKLGINLGTQNAVVALTSGSNNNVVIAPNGNTTTVIRFTVNSANSTLSGMDSTTVADGDFFIVRNESTTGSLLITNEDTNSLAGNRFLTPGAVTVQIQPRSSAGVEWDKTTGRWMASLVAPSNPSFLGNVSAVGSAIPVLSTCGTTPTIVAGSTSFAGAFTTGSGATTCTLTFATAFAILPTCIVNSAASAAVLIPTYSTSTTALTLSVDIASTAYQYICIGH